MADAQAGVQHLAVGKVSYALPENIYRFLIATMLLLEDTQPQKGAVIGMVRQRLFIKLSCNGILVGDCFYLSVVAVAECHAQAGAEVSMQGVELLDVFKLHCFQKGGQSLIIAEAQVFSKTSHLVFRQIGIITVIGDILYALQPDILRQPSSADEVAI